MQPRRLTVLAAAAQRRAALAGWCSRTLTRVKGHVIQVLESFDNPTGCDLQRGRPFRVRLERRRAEHARQGLPLDREGRLCGQARGVA